MIKKQLEKTLKDAIKEDAYIIGTKQVLGNISKSKLVLLQNLYQVISVKKLKMTQKNQKFQQFHMTTPLLTLENSVGYNLEFQPSH